MLAFLARDDRRRALTLLHADRQCAAPSSKEKLCGDGNVGRLTRPWRGTLLRDAATLSKAVAVFTGRVWVSDMEWLSDARLYHERTLYLGPWRPSSTTASVTPLLTTS